MPLLIPLKLSLRNFMCYRDNVPPLSFEGMHLACLCGDNGHGKSALLDAMTWALWGEARAKSDDELIYVGEREMEVELEFAAGPNRYRVVRKREKAGARRVGQTSLELHLADRDGFKAITGNTMRETQQKIIEILRMDYQTFINSAFLLQGRADEFTVKPPAERKKVLADILGLSFYDSLESRAKEEAKRNQDEMRALERSIDEMAPEIARKGEYEAQFRQVQDSLLRLDEQVRAWEVTLSALQQERRVLDLKKAQVAEIDGRIEQARRELASLEVQVAELRGRIEGYEKVMAESEAIERGYRQLAEAREANERLNEAQGKLLHLNEQKNQLERLVEAARGELATKRIIVENSVAGLQSKSDALPVLEAELEKSKTQQRALDEQERELAEKKQRQDELSQQIVLLRSNNAQLKSDMETLKEKIDLLAQADARCPLCETELGVEERERIEAKYEAEGRAKAAAYRVNEEELKQKTSEHNVIAAQVADLEAKMNRSLVALQSRVVTLEKEIGEGKEAVSRLAAARVELAQVEQKLEQGDYAPSEQAALETLVSQIAALGYNGEEHDKVRQRLAELREYEEVHQRLEEALRLLPRERQSLDEAQERIGYWRSVVDQEEQKREALSAELAALPDLLGKIASAQRLLDELKERRDENRQILGAVQQKLAYCADLERAKEEKARALTKAAAEKSIYDELALAFGKRGIQALIIEEALPEIEEEANRLLARMTDNRMHLKLETQRETRKGDTVETLDIKINDELGRRNYEMFSGGEAFRINFALRIALSKLLARRAGAPLPTLVIDEGFGTQDRSGMEKLIEAINSIQDDFERIIVVTHIEELKDVFPVRINVMKTEAGSMIEVT